LILLLCLCLIILLHASQKPAYNGHYVFNLLRVIKFVWICLNEFEFLDNLLDWMIDSMTHCIQNGILPENILHLISMFHTVCMCVVWMLSGHTTVHLSCWHCHVTYTVSCVATLLSPPLLWFHWIISCFPINAVSRRNIHTLVNVLYFLFCFCTHCSLSCFRF